jgi:hypothetical protein
VTPVKGSAYETDLTGCAVDMGGFASSPLSPCDRGRTGDGAGVHGCHVVWAESSVSPLLASIRSAVLVRHVSRRNRTRMGPWRSVPIRHDPRRWLLVAVR